LEAGKRREIRAHRRKELEKKLQGKNRQKILWHKFGLETEAQKHLAFERKQDISRNERKSRQDEILKRKEGLAKEFQNGRHIDEGRLFGEQRRGSNMTALVDQHTNERNESKFEAQRDLLLLQKVGHLEVKKNRSLKHQGQRDGRDTSVKGLLKITKSLKIA
jgi:hypothetical protein